MLLLSVIRLFGAISLLTKIKLSSQVVISVPSEVLATIDNVGQFNATLDFLTRRDHVLSKRTSLSIKLTKTGVYYAAPVIIDGQTLEVAFDTGSSNVVVAGTNCVSCAGLPFKYSPGSKPPTGETPLTVNYGAGPAIGLPYAGKVSIDGGMTNLLSQPFIVASSIPPSFISNKIDGVFGMSVGPTSASTKNLPFYYRLFDNYEDLGRVFAFSLSDSSGTLTFGGDQTGQDVSKINKLKATAATYWQVGLTSVHLPGNSNNIASVTSVVLDTGGTDISVPATDFMNLLKAVPELALSKDGSYYTIPCTTTWSISILFDGDPTPFVVPGANLMNSIAGDAVNCEALIKGSPAADALKSWILGVPFMKTVYSRFTVALPASANTPGTENYVGFVRV